MVSLLNNVDLDQEDSHRGRPNGHSQVIPRNSMQETLCLTFFSIVVLAIEDSFRGIFPSLILR